MKPTLLQAAFVKYNFDTGFRNSNSFLTFKLNFMKKFLPAFFSIFITAMLFAQDVKLNDTAILINDKPIALYAITPGNAPKHNNMEVYSLDDYVLIKAEALKFNAPVAQLKPFYYYELTFPPTADTFALYMEDEPFAPVLAKIINDYKLIDKNELNKKNVSRFINQYPGGPALVAKVKSFEDYLNETRYFDEQEKRDRTKPVSIINNRVIMQDGVKIGLIVVNYNYSESKVPISVTRDTSNPRKPAVVEYDYLTTTSTETDILFANGRKVQNLNYYNKWISEKAKKRQGSPNATSEKNLYQISIEANKNIGAVTDQYLMRVCALIEDYAL
jgi:hypothetical protein